MTAGDRQQLPATWKGKAGKRKAGKGWVNGYNNFMKPSLLIVKGLHGLTLMGIFLSINMTHLYLHQ